MKNLTECKEYQEVVELIKEAEWNTTQIASKCWHYHQNIALSKTKETAEKRLQVYQWLCDYQKEFHKGNTPSKNKEAMVGLLKSGMSIKDIIIKNKQEGVEISISTLYKYKKELSNEHEE